MKIIVVGCGRIGRTIMEALLKEGHEIIAMDSNPDKISNITNIYDVMTICGNGIDHDALIEAGADKADLLVAVTGSDEFNMLCCYLAKKLGAQNTIARIRTPEYTDQSIVFLKKELHLSMAINPEGLVAKQLFDLLKVPSAVKVEPFSRGNFEMIELVLKENSPLDGKSLIDIKKQIRENFLVGVVERENEVYIPDGNFVLKSGDKIGITASATEIPRLFRKLNLADKQARSVMILGGTRTAFYLAKMLIESGNTVKLIEPDKKRCFALSEALPEAVIICGDIADQELLLEEGIKNVDAVVTLTESDEENILLSYFALMQNVPKVVARVNKSEFLPTAQRLGIDSIVSPIKTVPDILVGYARALENSKGSEVETLYKLMNGNAEALEFKVKSDSKVINIPFKNMITKKNVLVGGIIRGRRAIIPSGEDMILPNDRVVIISAGKTIGDINEIMDGKR